MAKPLTIESDWDVYNKNYILGHVDKSPLAGIFAHYLIPDNKKNIIEIGCNPGKSLVFLYKTYKFKIWGIDFTNIKLSQKTLEYHQIPDFKLVEADFQTWKSDILFDVVYSSGFLEHFEDYDDLFERHARLLKPDGLLFLTVPNFRYGQYIFHWLFDREIFKSHNLKIMSLDVLHDLCVNNQLEILELSYFKTIDFWILGDLADRPLWQQIIIRPIIFIAKAINKLIGFIKPIPNRWFSPHLLLVARKPMI